MVLHFLIQGRVQGVGFRWFVEREASELDLRGWVRNTEEGEVEVVAAGEPADLDDLRSSLKRGPDPESLEASPQSSQAVLLSSRLPDILCRSRVHLNHVVSFPRKFLFQVDPPLGQHPHRTESDGKKADPALQEFTVARPEMFAVTVIERFSPRGKIQRRVDRNKRRMRAVNELKNLLVRKQRFPDHDAPAFHEANTRIPFRTSRQVDARHQRRRISFAFRIQGRSRS